MDNQVQGHTLLIDVGNSSLKWALLKMGSESNLLSKESLNNLAESKFDSAPFFIIECLKSIEKPKKIIASCVAQKEVWQALVTACDKLWKMDIQKVESSERGFGLINAYENPSDLGSDRWCAMIGALHVAKTAFIVVDAGSAITIDLVNESGQHLGGYITPGLKMMKKSLGLHTAQVKVENTYNSSPSLSLARSTTDCVEAGIHLSAVKLIEAVFEKESKQVNELQCYLTGGDAEVIANLLSFKCVMMPDIVLRGLAEIQKCNQE